MVILTSEITPKKVRGNDVDYLTIEVTFKKVCGNNEDFWKIKIIWKKVRGNNVDFLINEITFKKYVEMKWKLPKFGLRSIDYRRNIDIESTSI